jgi:hypothetical protein
MQELSLNEICKLFKSQGCHKVTVKKLSANDNSKNQIYLGGHEAIQLLPSVDTTLSKQTSKKKKADKYIFRNALDFYWLNNDGPHLARHSKLIYYPQYPETRFSGFLLGSKAKVNHLFDEKNKDNLPERLLFLGSSRGKVSFGYVAISNKKLFKSIRDKATPLRNNDDTFFELIITKASKDTKRELLKALTHIHNLGWIPSCRLNKEGRKVPYNAQNGGGYTLEAELGIVPNGDAEPDYLGWELKQHSNTSKVITLLTPEPDSGFYKQNGVGKFIEKYGYKDKKGREGRFNFGGIYRNQGDLNENTGLRLGIYGFSNGDFTSEDGYIGLFDKNGKAVAKWTFTKLMEHWSRKHSKAAFVLSERKEESKKYFYKFLNEVNLGVGTNFIMFLTCVEKGLVYLDPALKLETSSDGKTKTKARNQFRVNIKSLSLLYKEFEEEKL